jgi:hypothetical protein
MKKEKILMGDPIFPIGKEILNIPYYGDFRPNLAETQIMVLHILNKRKKEQNGEMGKEQNEDIKDYIQP